MASRQNCHQEERDLLRWLEDQSKDIIRTVLGALKDWRTLGACSMLCASFRAAADTALWERHCQAMWDTMGAEKYVPSAVSG